MNTSVNGIALIEEFEGLRLDSYLDLVGRETIGYGHLLMPGESYSNGITQTEAQTLLESDLAKVEQYLNVNTRSLNQNQFDALSSFAYNLGIGSLEQLLSHDIGAIPAQIVKWNHAGGQVVPGLTTRRQAELALWQTPVTT